jgi:uncharacterized membrane protein
MRLALVTAVIAAAIAVPASASPESDFNAVYADWKKDANITHCYWSQTQLQNASTVASGNPDFQYDTRFPSATQAEINRWKNGGCAGIQPIDARRKSPLFGVRIVSVRGRGGAGAEFVKIRNSAKRTISFRKASLTNLKGSGFYFPSRFKLAKGRAATVHVGCAKGKHRQTFTARAVWLCSRKGIFRDRGDLARLADGNLLVVSQRGFGTELRRPAF